VEELAHGVLLYRSGAPIGKLSSPSVNRIAPPRAQLKAAKLLR